MSTLFGQETDDVDQLLCFLSWISVSLSSILLMEYDLSTYVSTDHIQYKL